MNLHRIIGAIVFACMAGVVVSSVHSHSYSSKKVKKGQIASLKVRSTAFADGAVIPALYTGEGGDHSPQLSWKGSPAGTKSFVIIVDDPDAPE